MNDRSHTDKALFRLIAEGDEAAFRELFHAYVPQLEPLVMHLTKTASVTEDIIQETFLRVWLNRDKLPAIENPRSWLLRIIFYQSFTWLRRRSVHHKALDAMARGDEEMRSTTEEAVAYAAMLRLVGEAVQQLPSQAKKIYKLSRENGLRIPEIAAQLELSPNTVKNSLVRSLQAIRRHMEAGGYWLPLIVLWML
ncbi:sigma-70 family RNA polymerase sigma factor [Chitinophaga sp. YIM B06452]|uniref:RNA polymerase sigma factor n=1 Tax=Chitinophaga sp. YIM B06452 TaxID=3082158 RepID=UPI0031FE4FA7